MLVTFANHSNCEGGNAIDVVRVAAWILAEKFAGCTAEILAQSDGGRRVTVSLSITPRLNTVECFDWFTQFLADHSLTLIRDQYFERVMQQLGRTSS